MSIIKNPFNRIVIPLSQDAYLTDINDLMTSIEEVVNKHKEIVLIDDFKIE